MSHLQRLHEGLLGGHPHRRFALAMHRLGSRTEPESECEAENG